MGKPSSLYRYPYRCNVERDNAAGAIEYCLTNLGKCYNNSNFLIPIYHSLASQGVILPEDYIWSFKGLKQPKVRFMFMNKKDLFTFSIRFGVQGWQAQHPDVPQLQPETVNG